MQKKWSKQWRMNQVTTVAWCELRKWIWNPRGILLFVFLVFAKTLCIDVLVERAGKYGGTYGALESYVALGNSGVLVMLIPIVYLVLMSDYPKLDGNSLFFIQRVGKKNWMYGQMLFAAMSTAVYILAIFVSVFLISLPHAHVSPEWSEVTRFYASRFPGETDVYASQLLPPNIYNQVPLLPTLVYTLVFQMLYLYLLTMILLLSRLLGGKSAGLYACLLIVILGVGTCAVRSKLLWMFPMGNTILWLHYTEILRKPVWPVWYSYVYFGIMILGLMIVCRCVVKRYHLFVEEKL